MKASKLWTCLVMTALIVIGASADGFAFRCGEGKGIVGQGDTKGKVLIECGSPDNKIVVSTQAYSAVDGRSTPSIEKWYYNCGDNSFIYELEFVSDVLNSIGTTGRGSGPNRCQ
jgi:hypothetical protein